MIGFGAGFDMCIRRNFFLFPFSSYSRCKIKRTDGMKSSISAEISGYRVRISYAHLFLRFPLVFQLQGSLILYGRGDENVYKTRKRCRYGQCKFTSVADVAVQLTSFTTTVTSLALCSDIQESKPSCVGTSIYMNS